MPAKPARRTAAKPAKRITKRTAGRKATTKRGAAAPPPPPLVYTIPAAARELKVSDKTVRRLINEGELRARRVGTQLRITHAELERFLGLS
jgi:excisionase family DNA binding protein